MGPGGLLRAGRRCRCRRRRRCGCTGSGFGRMHGICTVFFTTHVGLVARRDDHVHRQRSKQDEANNNLPHINISWDGFVQSRGLARDAVHDSSRRMHLRARAVCRVAKPRNSCGYCCVLRLAAHTDPQRTLTARIMHSIPWVMGCTGARTSPLMEHRARPLRGGPYTPVSNDQSLA